MKGKLISFIGMDGAGKSTLVQKVHEQLKKHGYKVAIIYGGRGRNNLLPIQLAGKIYRKAGGTESNVPVTGKQFEKTSIFHTVAAPFFMFDMLLRYFFVIHPSLRKNDFVLTDRYSTDILLMNKVPKDFRQFLYTFLPKPSKLFYIYNSIPVLHKRKPEHPVADLQRQEKAFATILTKLHATKIKNDNIKKSTDKIIGGILHGD